MPRYTVHLIQTISTAVEVEADTPEEAIDAAWDDDDMPGPIAHNAFGRCSVDEGEWQASEVYDQETGKTVWFGDS